MAVTEGTRRIVKGADTRKDLHVAAVVDEQDRVMETRSFATTRQGYRQMLAWMRSFGELQRIGIKSTGGYGAGLLRFMQQAGITVSRSRRPTSRIAAGGARTMISTLRTRPCRLPGQRTVTPEAATG